MARTTIDNNSANRRPMTPNPLRCRRDDDVRAQVERARKPATDAEGVIDDEGDVVRMGNLQMWVSVSRTGRYMD